MPLNDAFDVFVSVDDIVRDCDERACGHCGTVFLTPITSRTHAKRCPHCDRYVGGYRHRSDAHGIRLGG